MDLTTIKYYKQDIQGAQGIVGECTYNGEICVFKRSRHIDHIISLEYDIMKLLENLPHFCRVKYHENDINLMEKYNKDTLGDLIYDDDIRYFSIIYQTMIAIAIAQQKVGFTHYDLHNDNILITTTPYDYITYILPSGQQYTVKTNGVSPVIIDFGYSYAHGISPYRTILEYMSEGYTTYEYDPLSDMIMFITTILYDMKKYCKPNEFVTTMNNLFLPLPLDIETGWYRKGVFCSMLAKIKVITPTSSSKKSVFHRFNINSSIELFNNMVELPLTEPVIKISKRQYRCAFKSFLKRWEKIEKKYDTNKQRMVVLVKYLRDHADDKDITTIVNKIKHIMVKVQTRNQEIKRKLYARLPVSNIKDILDMIIKPCTPHTDNIKVYDLT